MQSKSEANVYPSFTKVTPTRTFQEIARQIEEAILSGELKPDDRLPSEREMQKVFGVGRASVREAMRILENNGLLEVRTGSVSGGIYVKQLTPSYTVDSLQRLFLTENINIKELIEYRVCIEGVSAAWAAQRATAADIEKLNKVIAQMGATKSRAAFNNDDLQFHITIAQAAKNRIGTLVMFVIRKTLLRVMEETFSDSMDADHIKVIISAHRQIVAAIEAGDPDLARGMMEKHISDSYVILEKLHE